MLNEEDVAKIAIDILRTLAYCHERGVIHRNLRPEYILCDSAVTNKIKDLKPPRHIKIIDFNQNGINPAEEITNIQSNKIKSAITKARLSSIQYTAPEVVRGGQYDSKCDVWSIGIILYALMCGETPFAGSDST
jgi:serine/threonine protein kinase